MKDKKQYFIIFLSVILCISVVGVFAQRNLGERIKDRAGKSTIGGSGIIRGNLGQSLDQYLSRLEGYGFSGSVLVAKNGEIYLSKGYGLADRERSIPVTADTLFEGASLNKQFTAAAVMKLEQQGKLRVEDPITKYFDNVPDDKKGITLHHLMTHSAGFPNEFGKPDVDYSENPNDYYYQDRDEFVRAFLAAPLEYPTGTKAEYSNPSYSLVAAIIEKVSGQTYESFVQEQLLAPAGLTNTGFYTDLRKWKPEQIARGFDGTVEIERASYEHGWGTIGAGGILTSTNDLYKWELALRGDKILSAKSKEKLFAPKVPSGGGFDYAYGWRVHKSPRGTNIVWASGLVPEFSAMFQRYVDENTTIIFLTNNSFSGYPLRDVLVIPGAQAAIERIVFGKEYTLPPWFIETKPLSTEKYAGNYKTLSGEEFIVSLEKDTLRIAPRSQTAVNLLIPPITETPAADYSKYHENIEKGLAAYRSGKKQEAEKEIAFQGEKLEKQYGRFLSLERIVTIPDVRNARNHQATTYAELRFERGIVTYRWHWWNGELYEQQKPKSGIHLSVLPPFRQQSPEEFVTFHITLGMPLRVKFELANNGIAQAILIATPKGYVKAIRG
jgi:CubicO group peptidase (beta-lactamase class C family)